jgi:hypothetical protein
MPQIRKHMKKPMKGGFATSKMNPTTTSAHVKPMTGGSPASDIVMGYSNSPPATQDYITSPRIRDGWYDDSMAAVEPRCQSGGSPASDLVMESLGDKVHTVDYLPAEKIQGNMNSLNLYQTTGGSRRRRSRRSGSRRSNRRSRRSNRRSHRTRRSGSRRRTQRGGFGSDWIMSQYSLGPNNNPEQSADWVSKFSRSTATSRNEYMNPASLGLAGSGSPMGSLEGANVRHVGSPL